MVAVAKRYELDRYLSALLAPRAVRDDLITLAAFSAEVQRIAEHISEPMLGEIRIQWWRDAVSSTRPNAKTGHPVADALNDVIRRHGWHGDSFAGFFDVHAHRLYADPPQDSDALIREIDVTDGLLFEQAARILRSSHAKSAIETLTDADKDEARHILILGGRCYGLARIGLSLGQNLARGRVRLPVASGDTSAFLTPDWRLELDKLIGLCRGQMQQLRHHLDRFDGDKSDIIAAMLPVAVVEPYLRALQKPDHDPLRHVAEIAPLQRVWRLRVSHMLGRF